MVLPKPIRKAVSDTSSHEYRVTVLPGTMPRSAGDRPYLSPCTSLKKAASSAVGIVDISTVGDFWRFATVDDCWRFATVRAFWRFATVGACWRVLARIGEIRGEGSRVVLFCLFVADGTCWLIVDNAESGEK